MRNYFITFAFNEAFAKPAYAGQSVMRLYCHYLCTECTAISYYEPSGWWPPLLAMGVWRATDVSRKYIHWHSRNMRYAGRAYSQGIKSILPDW